MYEYKEGTGSGHWAWKPRGAEPRGGHGHRIGAGGKGLGRGGARPLSWDKRRRREMGGTSRKESVRARGPCVSGAQGVRGGESRVRPQRPGDPGAAGTAPPARSAVGTGRPAPWPAPRAAMEPCPASAPRLTYCPVVSLSGSSMTLRGGASPFHAAPLLHTTSRA